MKAQNEPIEFEVGILQSTSETEVVAYIGIGSNIGQRIHHLAFAVSQLKQMRSSGDVRCSPVYETNPVGYVDQPRFLNMVVQLNMKLNPFQLLDALHDIEADAGRTRTIRFGPRTLDLDILLYGNLEVQNEILQIPHPRICERAFVLQPLADLSPELQTKTGETVSTLAELRCAQGGIRYVGRFW